MNNRKIWALAVGVLMTLGICTVTFADDTDLAARCSRFITIGDDQFADMFRRPSRQDIAQLEECHLKSICSQFPNVAGCASLLSTRDFLINYFASAPNDAPPKFMSPVPSFKSSAPPPPAPIAPINPVGSNPLNTTPKPENTPEIRW